MTPVYLPDGSIDWERTLFHFEPTKAGPYVMIILFALAFTGHVVLALRLKTTYMIPMIIGCLLEVIGFVARELAADHPFDNGLYAMQQFLIIIAPVFFAASLYLILKHIIHVVDDALSPLKPKLIGLVFVGFDVLSFVVQGAASGLIVGADTNLDAINLGVKILIVGLLIQVVSFIGFLTLAFVYYARAHNDGRTGEPWRTSFVVLAASAVLVFVRSLFRVVEFWQGFDGQIAKVEALMYVFDAGLMGVVVVLSIVFHPGRYLDGPNGEVGVFDPRKRPLA
ncbi:RTA1 like protein-domain-containing protein [Zopfochytrium polystomum]|nr:RTA1 like protein-domain-containing protein [Zopfochytrium polystomum]